MGIVVGIGGGGAGGFAAGCEPGPRRSSGFFAVIFNKSRPPLASLDPPSGRVAKPDAPQGDGNKNGRLIKKGRAVARPLDFLVC